MKLTKTASIMLLLIIILVSSVQAELSNARIVLGSREITPSATPVFDGKRVLAPLDILDSVQATYSGYPDSGKITVTSSLGQSGTVRTELVKGIRMLPMDELASLIGAEHNWQPEQRTLTLTARLVSIEFVDDTLKINCTMPVSYKVSAWSTNNKLIVDIASTKLASPANEVCIGTPAVSKARLGQYGDNGARVVLDMEKNLPYRIDSSPLDSKILVKVAEGLAQPVAEAPVKPDTKAVQPFTVNAIRVQPVDENRFELVISTTGKGAVKTSVELEPAKIDLALNGGSLADGVSTVTGSHPLLSDVKIKPSSGGSIAVQLLLKRAMICDVYGDDKSLTIGVRLPYRAGGKLADKLIAIDPGHGVVNNGRLDNGAARGSAVEKDINMDIAIELAAQLEAEGARTILTRAAGDDGLAVKARPLFAKDSGADFFISIHCNSCKADGSRCGIETYYHLQEPCPKLLATKIHEEVLARTGMPGKLISDRKLFTIGLGVLRGLSGTEIPGILLECGYINHSSDRNKLLDSSYRKNLAAGIVAGLKEYVEGN